MSVRSVAAIVLFKKLVDDPPVFIQKLYRDATLRSCRRNRKARLHVLNDLECVAANGCGLCVRFSYWRRGHGFPFRSGCDGSFRLSRFSNFRGSLSWSSLSINWSGSAASIVRSVSLGSHLGIAEQLCEICAPRFVNQLGITAKSTEQPFYVGRIGAKTLRDYL